MVPILKVVHLSRYCPAAAQEHISDIHKCSAYELSPFRPLCKQLHLRLRLLPTD